MCVFVCLVGCVYMHVHKMIVIISNLLLLHFCVTLLNPRLKIQNLNHFQWLNS